MGMYIGVYVYAYTHICGMYACVRKRRGRQRKKVGNVCMCMYVCAYIPLFDPGIHRKQNKNHTPAAGRQSEIYLHSLLSPGRWMGPIWSPFTRSTMGVKEEEGCHTDMHKLEGRGIWKVLLRKPWWHNAGEKKGKEACLSLCFRWLFFKKIWIRVSGNDWYLRCLRCCGSWKVFCWHRALSQGQVLETKGRDKKINK